jgi:hypothetical protein
MNVHEYQSKLVLKEYSVALWVDILHSMGQLPLYFKA